jgi:hypothetical protein
MVGCIPILTLALPLQGRAEKTPKDSKKTPPPSRGSGKGDGIALGVSFMIGWCPPQGMTVVEMR